MSGALLHVSNGAAFDFLNSLKEEERTALRKAVRKVHMEYYPDAFFTDHEADKIIEAIGPETASRLLKAAVDSKIDRWAK